MRNDGKKLYFVYTNPMFMPLLFSPVMEEAFAGREGLDLYFSLDNHVLLETLKNNLEPTPLVLRRLFLLVDNCVRAGADCVVVGCTAINLSVGRIAPMFDIPVFSVDEPMVREVADSGARAVSVVSHDAVNAETVARRIRVESPDAVISIVVPQGAGEAFAADRTESTRILAEAVRREGDEGRTVVLSHITGDAVPCDGKAAVFKTGRCAVKAIERALARRKEG